MYFISQYETSENCSLKQESLFKTRFYKIIRYVFFIHKHDYVDIRGTYLISIIGGQTLMYFMKTVTTSIIRKKIQDTKKITFLGDFNKSYINNSLMTIDLSFIIGIKRGQQLYKHITHGNIARLIWWERALNDLMLTITQKST